jgi:hypothetical protein
VPAKFLPTNQHHFASKKRSLSFFVG